MKERGWLLETVIVVDGSVAARSGGCLTGILPCNFEFHHRDRVLGASDQPQS